MFFKVKDAWINCALVVLVTRGGSDDKYWNTYFTTAVDGSDTFYWQTNHSSQEEADAEMENFLKAANEGKTNC